MTAPEIDPEIAALIELHRGTLRQGPGDDALAAAILDRLDLPPSPIAADLGCGSGPGALLLARRIGARVAALDLALPFLADLRERAAAAGVAERVLPVCADIADPPLAPASLDLLWSEGAAYAVGFEAALRAWRPLLAPAGRAVVSEMTWFAASPADEARAYWQAAYPGMADEATSRARAEAAGFRVLEVVRLPAEAWWTSYYGPLAERIAGLGPDERERLAGAVAETEAEIGLFERHGGDYGYAFHVLAVA